MKNVLKNRSLVIMGISESVTTTGSWITMMAVTSMIIFRGQGSITQSGLIFLAGLVPTLVFSPVAGWLCDRFDRKWLMIISEVLSGAAVSGLIFVESFELIYSLIALQAVCASIMGPARQSSVPIVVDRDHLTQANSLLQQLASIIKIFAPILAGALLSIMTPHQAVILDVISFGLSAVILSFLPSLKPQNTEKAPQENKNRDGVFSPLVELIKSNSQLALLYGMAFVAMLGIVTIDILVAVYTRDVLKGGENFLGIEIGLIGLGTLLGAITLMARKKKVNPWSDIISGLLMIAVTPAAMALGYLITNLIAVRILVFFVCLLGGFGIGRKMVQVGTLLQTLPPANMLGRASGLFQSVVVFAQIIGTVVTPLLVPVYISGFAYLCIVSGIILFAALVGVLSQGRALFALPQTSVPVQE